MPLVNGGGYLCNDFENRVWKTTVSLKILILAEAVNTNWIRSSEM
jgi:hypothetical protein